MDDLTALAEAFGIAADASEEDVLEAAKRVAAENADLKAKIEKAPDEETVKTLIADAAKGAEAAKRLAEREKREALDTAVRQGKIVPAERESFEKLYDLDPEGVTKILAEKPVTVSQTPAGATDARVYGADGEPLQQGEGGDPIVADLAPQMVDGTAIPVVPDTAKIVAAAESDLRSKGKTSWTEDEFAAACEAAMSRLGIVREYAPDVS